jgi:hypothetical protein
MSWFAVGAAAIGAIGAMSSGGNNSTSSSQATLDPRIANYLYGGSGGGGLLNSVNNTFAQQAATGGLNPLQTAGLEMQRQTLTAPNYTQGYDQMRSLGSSLLGGGVAGNPFTGGGPAMAQQPQQMPPQGSQMPPQQPQGQTPGMSTIMPVFGGTGQMPMVSGGAINANTVRGPQTGLLAGPSNAAYQPITNAAYQPITSQAAPQAPFNQNDLLALLRQQQNNTVASGGPGYQNADGSLNVTSSGG